MTSNAMEQAKGGIIYIVYIFYFFIFVLDVLSSQHYSFQNWFCVKCVISLRCVQTRKGRSHMKKNLPCTQGGDCTNQSSWKLYYSILNNFYEFLGEGRYMLVGSAVLFSFWHDRYFRRLISIWKFSD